MTTVTAPFDKSYWYSNTENLFCEFKFYHALVCRALFSQSPDYMIRLYDLCCEMKELKALTILPDSRIAVSGFGRWHHPCMEECALRATLCFALNVNDFRAYLGLTLDETSDDRLTETMHRDRAKSICIPAEIRTESKVWLARHETAS